MLRDPKSTFKYRPSYDTDIRRTFARVRRELKAAQAAKAAALAARKAARAARTAPATVSDEHVVPMRRRGSRSAR